VADPSITQRSVTVAGVGRAAGVPDVLRLQCGAEAEASSAEEALDRCSAGLTRMRDVLTAAGVTTEDLVSSGLSLYHDAHRARFTARLGLRATVRDVSAAGRLVTEVVRAGGDTARLDSVAFEHSDPISLDQQARSAAFEEARARASQYAELAGASLGAVQSVEEAPSSPGVVPRLGRMSLAAAEASVPIEPGTAEVQVRVEVRWELR
jgi:uncharacterized protein YggE